MHPRPTSKILAALLLLGLAAQSQAQSLFVTGRADTIRTSTDGGATWSVFTTVAGAQLRGVEVARVGAENYVFANNPGGGVDDTARPLYAFDATGAQVASTTYNRAGAFSEQPLGYLNGFLYFSTGGTPENVFMSFDGVAFGTVTNSNVGNWQGNNLAFAASGDTTYLFTSGAGGTGMRRNSLTPSGAAGAFVGVGTTGGPANLVDIAFTPSGRLLTMGSTGIFLSAPGSVTTDSIALTSALAFTGTEDAATGDMGGNARDFALVGDSLFAITNTRVFHYTLNDAAGTLSFIGAYSHGFNSTGVQIAGVAASSAPSPLAAFRTANGLAADGSQDALTPAGDGVSSLLKYAFNMIGSGVGQAASLDIANAATLAADGSAGLPLVSVLSTPGTRLQLTYIRRKSTTSPEIGYAVLFGDTLAPDSLVENPSATESVTSIDDTFERVTVTDSVTVPARRFARVSVSVQE